MATSLISQESEHLELLDSGLSKRASGSGGELLSSRSERSFWHRSAPKRVVRAYCCDGDSSGWRVWARYLSKRASRLARLSSASQPLLWGVTDPQIVSEWNAFSKKLAKLRDAETNGKPRDSQWIRQWLAASPGQPTLSYALECLALAEALPQLAATTSSGLWWEVVEHLFQTAKEAARVRPDFAGPNEPIVVLQLLAGELALVLACQLPEMKPVHRLDKLGREVLSESIIELLDGDGLPHANQLPAVRLLLACWTRCRALGERLKRGPWSSKAEAQYQWLVRQAIRLTRWDGNPVFGDPAARDWQAELFRLALKLGGDAADHAAAEALLPKGAVPPKARFQKSRFPVAAVHSEWSGLAVMAGHWPSSSPRLTVDYSGRDFRIELACRRRLLFSGVWECESSCDGETLVPEGSWEELCWFEEDDCNYLELAIDLAGGGRLERQILLAHNDEILYLSDVLKTGAETPQVLCLASHFPLGPGIKFVPEKETCDGTLKDDKPQATVFPLSLPEWRLQLRDAQLAADGSRLSLRQERAGRNLYSALFLDLRSRRMLKQRTWRQLTVGENLEIQPHDVAVGYRIQSGQDQWIAYRSLDRCANRSLIGQNVSSEFYIGRFLRSGEVDEYLELESE